MASTDGVFDEGTFDNATFNNITRSETVSVSDTANSEADLFRSLNESVGVDEGSVEVEHGYFQTPSSNTTITEDIGINADVVEFRVTSTNPTLDAGQKVSGGDFGWGHGYVAFQDNGIDEYSLSHGSGSASTNGHISESTNSYSVFQLVTDAAGDNLEGKIRGSVTQRDGSSIDISFDETQKQQYVFYTAYSYDYADLEVGFFQAENTNTTQSITSLGFQPNFLRLVTTPNLESMDTTVNELGTGQGDVGWGQGVAVENNAGVKQGSLAVSQWPSNIDGHAYTSSDSDVLSIAYMTNKQSLNGETKASVSFTSNGFDLTYNTTTNPNDETPVVLYLAANTLSEPDAGFETTPTTTGEQDYSTDVGLGNLLFVGSNTVPFFDDGSGVGRRTWGWNYGTTDFGSEEAIGFASNSDSVNGHHWENETDFAYDQLYADNNGNLIGRDRATVVARDGDGFTLDWTQITTTADNSNYVISDSVAFFWYGFSRTSQVGGEQSILLDKSVSESLGLNDNSSRSADLFRDLNESFALNDEETLSLLKSLQEAVSLVDSTEKKFLKSLSDSFSLQDNSSRSADLFRDLNESFALNDEQSDIIIVKRALQETLGVQDNTGKNVSKVLDESANFLDNVSSEAELQRQVSESLNLSDEESAFIRKKISEGIDLNDTEAELLLRVALSENISVGDNVETTAEFFRTLSENLNLVEADIREVALELSETLNPTDTVNTEADLFRAIAETVNVSDNSSKAVFKALVEFLDVNDSRSNFVSKSLAQTFVVGDNLSKFLTKNLQEDVTVSDELERTIKLVRSESVGFDDKVERVAELFRDVSETIDLTDSDIKQLERTLTEGVTVDDNFDREVDYFRSIAEEIVLNDETVLELRKGLSEVVSLSDRARSEAELFRTVTEQVSLADNLSKKIAKSFSESFNVSDEINRSIGKKLSESIDLDDVVTSFEPAQEVATEVEIQKLQKAVANITATRKAVAELDKF